jgi:hypothetical protein
MALDPERYVIGDDGLLVEKVGPWAKDKLEIVGNYIQISGPTRRKYRENRPAFIDIFCGQAGLWSAATESTSTNLERCLWPAAARSRFPAPIGSEAGTVPADHRLRLENFQCVQYSRS